ncbi:BrkB/YihY/UPF0761 family membrane protein, possible virulence factor [Campylobacter blaseri]|uniref:Trehalose-6-phosphate synthase n=1 Tax=Campylobacter blaseri TaxID=2042961 RepID=A0A2P8QZU5_9BACT|nr:YihY family inner membrane protein [Campylobacter blaseri]PSM51771.1 hypothetical protein CQ405_06485 [Campylobacter blaseri]PSM53562.1 hypothetical protein CRN67_06490 [Campylobacter blaseri]QKF86371.1 BrkB/YihY/UPF0761 family membrane protein, possible virulence factor [Campylobacter blaseri]
MKISSLYKKSKDFYSQIHDKELMHNAAGLSFYTILSIIPVLLLSLSIFTQMPSFDEYYGKIKEFIFSSLLPSHQDTISSYIEQFLSNSANLGILGFFAIIVATIMFFDNYNYVVNKIIGSKSRGFWQDFSKYWTLITLAPLGLGLSFYLTGKMQIMLNENEFTSWINILAIVPYLIIWAIFSVTYIISINTIIDIKKMLISSFIISIIWNISKIIFIKYAFYNKTYLSLYGSFSVILFFFLWIYVSWIIYLYGFKIYQFLTIKKIPPTKKDN